MNRQKLLQKLEEGVSSLRQAIEANEGSALKTLKASAEQGFKSIRDTFSQNEKSQKALAEIKKHLEDFEQAVEKGDKRLSAKLLATADEKLAKYKEKYCKENDCENQPPKQVDDSEPPRED